MCIDFTAIIYFMKRFMQVHYASPNYDQLFVKASCFNGWGDGCSERIKTSEIRKEFRHSGSLNM